MRIRFIINHITGEYEGEDKEMSVEAAKELIKSLSNGDTSLTMIGRRANGNKQQYQFSVKVLRSSVISYRIIE